VLSDIEAAKLPSRTKRFYDIERMRAADLVGHGFTVYQVTEYEDMCYGWHHGELDDRVDRKITRYLNETRKRKIDAINAKIERFLLERRKLEHAFKSNQMNEDIYDNSRKELENNFQAVTDQVMTMLDCGEALMEIAKFIEATVHWGWGKGGGYHIQIPESVKKASQKSFNDIREIKRIVFYLVDGKACGDSFVYKIAGFIDCVAKSGIFSTKLSNKYFSAEVDPKSRKMFSFNWEQSDSLNVQEYQARPLALPKFS
jgi:hypothetical protein